MEATIIIKDKYPFEDDEKTFIFHMIGGGSSIQIEPIKQVVDSTFLKYWMLNKEIQESVDIHISDTWLKELTTADIDELINTLVMLREDKLAKLGG